MASAIVFLDVDGVILPFNYSQKGKLFPDEALESLSFILEEIDAKLVLSSTWRVQEAFRQQIIDDFHRYGKSKGGPLKSIEFFSITDPTLHSERQHEIAAWLRSKYDSINDSAPWVALDDEELVDGKENKEYRDIFRHNVVKTDSHKGLTMNDAQLAVHLIKQQQLQKYNAATLLTGYTKS